MRVSECGRKIRNANRMPKSDDRTESNLRRGREGGRKTRRRRGEVGWGGKRGEGKGERGEGRGERGEGRGERGEGRGGGRRGGGGGGSST